MSKRKTPPQHEPADDDIHFNVSENDQQHSPDKLPSSHSDTDRIEEDMLDTADHDIENTTRKPRRRKRRVSYSFRAKIEVPEPSSRVLRSSTRLAHKPPAEQQTTNAKESSSLRPSRAKATRKTKKHTHDNIHESLNTTSEQGMERSTPPNHVDEEDATATASSEIQPSSTREEEAEPPVSDTQSSPTREEAAAAPVLDTQPSPTREEAAAAPVLDTQPSPTREEEEEAVPVLDSQPTSTQEEAAAPVLDSQPTTTQEEGAAISSPLSSQLSPALEQPVDVLSSLIEFPDLDDYTRGSLAIAEALRLNMEMQQHAENQLGWINERIRATQELMQNVRDLSSMEVKMDQKPVKIHKKYPTTYDFFIDEDGNKPPIATDPSQQDTIDQSMGVVRRTWSNSERQRLFDGVHAEARRALVVSIVASKEEHKIWEVDKMSDKELENVPVDKLNWKRISALYVHSRTPVQCIIQWTTQEHPRINKKPWSKAESQKLHELVEKHGIYGKWELIAKEHGSNRTASQCFSRYQSERNTSHSKKKWTEEDDLSLREAVALLGEGNWQQTASMLGNRTGNQCLQRWMKSLNPAIRRGKWTEQEDETLRRAVNFYGVGNWNKIQRHLPGRTDMQARERWTNILDPSLTFAPFTAEEEERLYALIEEHGRKWSMLTKFFPGRTDNHLLRFWKMAETRKAKAAEKAKSKRSRTKGKAKASS